MKAKIMIAIVATFAMLFAGVAVADSVDAESEDGPDFDGTGVVKYKVGDKVFQVPFADSKITLATIDALGATAPEYTHFVEWKNADAKYVAGSTFIPTTSEVEFVAVFGATTYTATFLAFDGTTVLDTIADTLVTVDSATGAISNKDPVVLDTILDAETAREGYIFIGWLADGATESVKTLGNLTADVTYTAQYMVDFKVTFIDNDKTYITKVSDLTVPDLGTRTGFKFLGWFTTVGTGEDAKDAMCMTAEDFDEFEFVADTTFTAKWEPVNCFVTFVAGDLTKTVPVLYGQAVGMLALPDGFESWATKTVTVVPGVDGADATENVTFEVYDFATPVTEDITLYGQATVVEPSGFDDPYFATIAIFAGIIILIVGAVFVSKIKKGEFVIGRGPNAKKNKNKNEEGDEGTE